jgi:Zn-dependent peptidase ImmA (M78 family)/DNA-binding XRE family transcriptional regulator
VFNPTRLSLARRRRGYTKTRLAKTCELSIRSLTAYEAGATEPSAETVARLASALDFPPTFFEADELDEVTADAASFRSLSKLTAAKRDQALTAATLALDVHRWISQRFRLPAVGLPDYLDGEDPERAAEIVRMEWGLGESPVPNVVHLLEVHGVRVFSLSEDYAEVDAFSFWSAGIPFVFLNTKKSAERSRMDAAHELGHLLLHHRNEIPRGREVEQEAKTFASAFLMPNKGLVPGAPRFPSIDQLIVMKKKWKVSLAALAYRLHAVGVISDWHYRSLYMDISRRGYRSAEPHEIRREMSQVLDKVLRALRDDKIGISDIACDLHLPIRELSALWFGLVMVPVHGSGVATRTATGNPSLTLHEGGRRSR